MSQESLNDSSTTDDCEYRHGLNAEKPLIKILLYTDDPVNIPQTNKVDLGLGLMIEHLKAHEPAFASLYVKWVSRNSSNEAHADNKIDDVLKREIEKTKQPFDEIWFFGLLQANQEKISFGVLRSGPESELNEGEVLYLQRWMEVEGDDAVGGGVLMAGDHGHPRPDGVIPGQNPRCPDNSSDECFLGRGRAIGRCVPRAGQLRQWEGKPTNRSKDSFNTESPGFETDRIPQELILRNVNAVGDPDPNGQPHPLFRYKPGSQIDVLPDHQHEGTVIKPKSFDPDVWRGKARPHVVARGIDKRHSKLLDLVMTYNGDLAVTDDLAGVGRIVADTSWHHYFNVNLRKFRHPAPEGSAGDKIGQFYGNLAIWLCPRSKRYEMARAMLWQLAKYTLLMEDLNDELNMGRAAYAILSQTASPCEIHEMIQAAAPEQFRALYFPEGDLVMSHIPSQQLLLGCVLGLYHQEIIQAENSDALYEPLGVDKVIESGFMNAFIKQVELLGLKASETLKLIG